MYVCSVRADCGMGWWYTDGADVNEVEAGETGS